MLLGSEIKIETCSI